MRLWTLLVACALTAAGCSDAGTPQSSIGSNCERGPDCASGLCIPMGASRGCTDSCDSIADCPTGFACDVFGGISGKVCQCTGPGCGAAACGDGMCDSSETCDSCAADCGSCTIDCGNDVCGEGENCNNCVADCGSCAGCGDGVCQETETCVTCAGDCGACPLVCGDAMCIEGEETCEGCPADCGACPATCGDSMCTGDETCTSCPMDCGPCCSDTFPEPDDTRAEAVRIERPAPISCEFSASRRGLVAGAVDVDYSVVATVSREAGRDCIHTFSLAGGSGLEVCVVPRCPALGVTASVSCRSGVASEVDGEAACCSTGGPVVLTSQCRDEGASLVNQVVRLRQSGGMMCVPYTLGYSGGL